MPTSHRHFLQVSLPLFRVCSPSENFHLSIIKPPRRALHLSTSAYNFSYYLTFLSYMTRAWGMPTSFVYRFYFLSLETGLGLTVSPLPLTRSLLYFLSTLFITMVLSVKETLMYFGYMYAPNLTHQGASVITKISFCNIA
jgi:hypothetical protein